MLPPPAMQVSPHTIPTWESMMDYTREQLIEYLTRLKIQYTDTTRIYEMKTMIVDHYSKNDHSLIHLLFSQWIYELLLVWALKRYIPFMGGWYNASSSISRKGSDHRSQRYKTDFNWFVDCATNSSTTRVLEHVHMQWASIEHLCINSSGVITLWGRSVIHADV